jgi:hypothetical protein
MNEVIRKNRLLANIIFTVVTSLMFQGGPWAEMPRASQSEAILSNVSGIQINKGIVGKRVRNYLHKKCVGAKDSELSSRGAGLSSLQSFKENVK